VEENSLLHENAGWSGSFWMCAGKTHEMCSTARRSFTSDVRFRLKGNKWFEPAHIWNRLRPIDDRRTGRGYFLRTFETVQTETHPHWKEPWRTQNSGATENGLESDIEKGAAVVRGLARAEIRSMKLLIIGIARIH